MIFSTTVIASFLFGCFITIFIFFFYCNDHRYGDHYNHHTIATTGIHSNDYSKWNICYDVHNHHRSSVKSTAINLYRQKRRLTEQDEEYNNNGEEEDQEKEEENNEEKVQEEDNDDEESEEDNETEEGEENDQEEGQEEENRENEEEEDENKREESLRKQRRKYRREQRMQRKIRLQQRNNPNDEESSTSYFQQPNQQLNSKPKITKESIMINRPINDTDVFPFQLHTILQNINILIVIVSFDFSQIPHLEEVLSSYHDVCLLGINRMDIHIHTTIAYPVILIDMLNQRFSSCKAMAITIVIQPKSLRLFLVDCHRQTFYDNINNYDLFIYSEDDIILRPTNVAMYLYETKYIEYMFYQEQKQRQQNQQQRKKKERNAEYIPSNYNVGIVRYEYNYPSNVIMDDNTRHATKNVSRVYWEHSGPYDKHNEVMPTAVRSFNHRVFDGRNIPLSIGERYVSMKNHHQGMYLATRSLLEEWDQRPNCNFSIPRRRPGGKWVPTEGTQRVWMSSHMLYGNTHCGVYQVLPMDTFSTLTVYHIPNKNYRRVGKYNNRIFSDGTEVFVKPHETLLTEMELHIALQKYKQKLKNSDATTYSGLIRMVDQVTIQEDRTELLDRRMKEYKQYVNRGGRLSDHDLVKIDLATELLTQ